MALTRLCLSQPAGWLMSMVVSTIVPSGASSRASLTFKSVVRLVPSHLLRGGRLTARLLHHPLYLCFGQGHALLHSSSPPSNFAVLACIHLPAVFLHVPLLRCCFCSHSAHCLLLFRLPPQHSASIDALAHKRNQPSPTLTHGVISTLTLLPMADGHAKQIPTAKA
jgi:hypothetical protein